MALRSSDTCLEIRILVASAIPRINASLLGEFNAFRLKVHFLKNK